MKITKTLLCCLIAISWHVTHAFSQSMQTDSASIATIRNIIMQTAKAINENRPDSIMKHYSKDILVSYPGFSDTNFDEFYTSYKQMLKPGIITSTVPTIQEILVSGDLAMVRMIWETTITETELNKTSRRKAKDLQIWRRENGDWKFFRGMWYHIK